MLSNQVLSNILEIPLASLSITDIHWKTQESTSESILFYRLASGQKSMDLFSERIKKTDFGWLVLNIDHPMRPKNSSVIEENKWPQIQKEILDHLYPMPALKMLALTGTNGKTTTTDLALQLGEKLGKKGFSIGTLGVRYPGRTILDFGLTSPPFIDLRKYLYLFGSDKDFCVMEASSHALSQKRIFGISFDAAGWLSFSQDHLDYHGNMDNYFSAKALIVDQLSDDAKIYVPDEQDDLFKRLSKITLKVREAPVISGPLPLFFSTKFNRNNLEVALALVEDVFKLKLSQPEVVFQTLESPEGRFFIRPYGTSFIVVDFAHTQDALQNVLEGIRSAFPKHAVKVLFGCGGDRDRSKRPLMGEMVSRYAAKIYLTSDNPRNEDPELIIKDILPGIKTSQTEVIVDRPTAVKKAFSELGENEVLLLAGKGHEDYILKLGIKHPYSDIKEVENFLRR